MKYFIIFHLVRTLSKDDHGSTALHYAAKTGQIKCIELLLENGADVHIKVDSQISCDDNNS